MIKSLVFTLILALIVSTSLIKNSTRDLDEQIYSIEENILFLEDRFKDSKLEFIYLSSSEKLLEFQLQFFEDELVPKKIENIKVFKTHNKDKKIQNLKITKEK